MTKRIIVKKEGAVGRLIFNQPKRRNAISLEMWQAIPAILKDFAEDDQVRTIVLAGEGGTAFSAGADISEFDSKRSSDEEMTNYNHAVGQAEESLGEIDKPTVAHIEGFCMGGGMALALCCDLRIAADDAYFGITPARLGVGYEFSKIQPLVQLVGPSFAKEILFTGRRFNAQEALSMGLINRLISKAEIDRYVNVYADNIANNAPLTVFASKTIVRQVLIDPRERDMELCQKVVDVCNQSDDYREGRRAFMEKRPPEFTGK
ncbi:enoyl-CoA hydratase [Pseudomonadota bacterium]